MHNEHDHSGHGAHDHDHGHDHGHDPSASAPAGSVRCPVMPQTFVQPEWAESKGYYRDFAGTRYWFCCSACPPLWDADPARYANAV